MTSKRMNFADMMKGIAILFFVIYHIMAPCGFRSIIDHFCDSALIIFVFYSGFFYKPGAKSYGENLKARTKGLLIPFFKYSLFFWLVGSIVLVAKGEEKIAEAFFCLRNFLAGCIWNRTIQDFFGWEYYHLGRRYPFLADFWFLIAMMFSFILFIPIADRVLKSKTKTLIAAALLVAVTGVLRALSISLPYNVQLVPFWTAVLLLGAFAGQHKIFDTGLKDVKETMAAIISLAAGAAICMIKQPNYNVFRGAFAENEVVSMVLTLASSLLIIWGGSIICRRIESNGVRVKEIAWLGSHSLLIYLYHMFFVWIICRITGFSTRYEEPVPVNVVWKSVLLTVACLTLCILRYVIGDRIAEKSRTKS